MTEKKPPLEITDPEEPLAVDLQERFGLNFRNARKLSGLTQVRVAELSGLSQGTISDVESGQVNLTMRYMQKLAQIVACDVADLVGQPIKTSKKR